MTRVWRRIAAHEWRIMRTDGLVWPLALLLATTVAWGLYSGLQSRTVVMAGITSAQSDESQRYSRLQEQLARRDAAIARGDSQIPADPRSASTLAGRTGSRAAVLPPTPTALLSVGQSDLLPSALRVSSEPREQMLAAAEIENPHRLLDGRFDLSFVVVSLLPLVVITLAFNLLAGEREHGTLALLLAQPVSLTQVVSAKVVVRFGFVLAVSLAMVGAGVLIAGLGEGPAGAGWRLAGWTVTVLVYVAFWFAVSLLMASRGWSSATTALATAAVWLAAVVVIPSLTNLIINATYPVPSRVELVQATREASDSASTRGSVLLAQFFEDHPEMAPVVAPGQPAAPNFAATRVAVASEVARMTEPVARRYDEQLARQQQAASWFKFLSPALLAREALDDFAGTGPHRHADFRAQVDRFHATWLEYFNPRIVQRAALASFDDVPAFTYTEESAGRVLGRAGTALTALALLAGLCGLVGLRRLRTYPLTHSI